MPAERYYSNCDLQEGQTIALADQEFHHLIHVMRAKTGDAVELVNGRGALAAATVSKIEKRQALLEMGKVTLESKQDFEVILVQAIPRINRLDFILEKGTELGMTQLWLFPGDLSERKELKDNQLERAQAQVIAAMKQCGRLWAPEIKWMPPLKEWKTLKYPAYFGDVNPEAELFMKKWDKAPPTGGVLFFVGPEAGFTEREEKKLMEMGAKGVKLHRNILRTDTASLVALSLISQLNRSEF